VHDAFLELLSSDMHYLRKRGDVVIDMSMRPIVNNKHIDIFSPLTSRQIYTKQYWCIDGKYRIYVAKLRNGGNTFPTVLCRAT
jgi:hypothetical protein